MTLGRRPAATDEVRRHNTALVLRVLRDDGPGSRADLALRTGLAKATVGTIVAGLQEAGVVAEGSRRRGRPRPARAAGRPRGGRPVGLGVEVNVDYVAVVALDLAGGSWASRHPPVAGPLGRRPRRAGGDARDLADDLSAGGLLRSARPWRCPGWSTATVVPAVIGAQPRL